MTEAVQIQAIRDWVNGDAHADHETFCMGRDFAVALLAAIDGQGTS